MPLTAIPTHSLVLWEGLRDRGVLAGAGAKFKSCSRCGLPYCSKECQTLDWKRGGHKLHCKQFASLVGFGGMRLEITDDEVTALVLRNVRMYTCPFTVCKYREYGRGFLFGTSSSPISDFVFEGHVNARGQRLERLISFRFATLAEYDKMCEEHSAFTVVSETLRSCVTSYNPQKEIVFLFLCEGSVGAPAFLTCVLCPLVPDFGMCEKLGVDYAERDMIAINLDDEDS